MGEVRRGLNTPTTPKPPTSPNNLLAALLFWAMISPLQQKTSKKPFFLRFIWIRLQDRLPLLEFYR